MPTYKDKKRNTYYFRVWGIDEFGKRKQYQRSGFLTLKEAKKEEQNFINDLNKDTKNITFQELYNLYIQHKRQTLKPQSLRSTISKFNNHILPFFKDYIISKIDNKIYLDWKDYIISKGFNYKYNSALHGSMVSIFNYAITFEYLEKNIASKVGNFSKANYISKVNYWDYDEFKQFISVVDNRLYKILYSTLYYTGIRLGECLALTWNDFKETYIEINKTLAKGKINDNYVITTPKTTTSNRKVSLDTQTINELNELKRYYQKFLGFKNEWFIFGGYKALSQTTIGRKKNEYCRKAQVKQIKIHDFRHSHASLLISSGMPVTIISERLGHKDKDITLNTYSHLFESDEKRAVDYINKIRK